MERDQAIKLMQDLLRAMKAKNGSDLFITANFPPAMKVDGQMTPVTDKPLTSDQAAMLVIRADRGGQAEDLVHREPHGGRQADAADPRRTGRLPGSGGCIRHALLRPDRGHRFDL